MSVRRNNIILVYVSIKASPGIVYLLVSCSFLLSPLFLSVNWLSSFLYVGETVTSFSCRHDVLVP